MIGYLFGESLGRRGHRVPEAIGDWQLAPVADLVAAASHDCVGSKVTNGPTARSPTGDALLLVCCCQMKPTEEAQ